MEQSAENPSDRNSYSLEGEKRAERHLCLFLQNLENTVYPSCLHKIKPAANGSREVFANTQNQSPIDLMACFLSFPPLGFQDDNSVCVLCLFYKRSDSSTNFKLRF